MSDAITALLAGTVLDKKLGHSRQLALIERFVQFICCVYTAPAIDLQPLQDLEAYRQIDEGVTKIAVKAFKNHLWYMTAELVPLAPFSHDVAVKRQASYGE